jgi:hypothetical protein
MAVVVIAVVGFFAIIAFVAYMRKRNYHAPDLDAKGK